MKRNLVPITAMVNGWRHLSKTDIGYEGFYFNEKKKWHWWNGWIWVPCADKPLVRILNKVSLGFRPAIVFIGEPPEEKK